MCVYCVCVCVVIPFILDVRFVDVLVGVTQEEEVHTGFLHLPSAVLALIFVARRIQLFLSPRRPSSRILCTNDLIALHLLDIFIHLFIYFCKEKSQFV